MLHFACLFFVIAIIAAVFGFGEIFAGAVHVAMILFYLFLLLAGVTFILNFFHGGG